MLIYLLQIFVLKYLYILIHFLIFLVLKQLLIFSLFLYNDQCDCPHKKKRSGKHAYQKKRIYNNHVIILICEIYSRKLYLAPQKNYFKLARNQILFIYIYIKYGSKKNIFMNIHNNFHIDVICITNITDRIIKENKAHENNMLFIIIFSRTLDHF